MVRAIFENNMKFFKKDPMMWAIVLMPIMMITFFQVVVRLVPFISDYEDTLRYLFIAMSGTMPGAILGLRVLDEKDEHLIPYYSVTPLTLRGYYGYRAVSSFLIGVLEVAIVSIGVTGSAQAIPVLYGGLLGVMMTFVTGGIAKNKVQGMVFLKLFGVVVLLPCIRLLGENRYNQILQLIPWDYMYMHMNSVRIDTSMSILYFSYVILIIALFYHKALK